MKRIFILAVLTTAMMLMLTSCGSQTAKNAQTAQSETLQPTVGVDRLLSQGSALVGQQVVVEGICTHICRHGARKIFLMGTDDSQIIRIEASRQIGAFKPECVNNIVRVTGTLIEDRIDEAYLVHWEQQLAAQIAEQHGHDQSGCAVEQQARNERGSSVAERIAGFRARIADRQAKEGKNYLSFYHIEGGEYRIEE